MTQANAAAGTEEAYPRYRWVIIALIYTYYEANNLVLFTLGILLPAMRQELGFGVLEAGWLGAAAWIGPAILSIPAALLVVRFRPKLVFGLSLLVAAIAAVAQGRAPVFMALLVARFAYASLVAVVSPAVALLRLQWVPQREFAFVIGLGSGLSSISQTVGFVVTPFLLIALNGWRNVLQLFGLLILLLALVWFVCGRERITASYRESLSSASSQGIRAQVGVFLRYKELWMIGIAVFGNVIPWISFLTFWPTYLIEQRGLSLATAGLVMGLLPVGGLLASLSVGHLSDRIGRRKPTIWPAGLLSPFLYFAMLLPVPPVALAGLALVAGYLAFTPVPGLFTIPYELPGIKPAEVPIGESLTFTLTRLGSTAGPLLVGAIYLLSGSLHTALLVSCLFPLSITVVGLLLPETGPAKAA